MIRKDLLNLWILRGFMMFKKDSESSIMKLATSPCLKIFVLLSFSK
ncbi:hypothetical protein GPW28_08240, partial [Streptococcus thermophilus]|nr:hypothetical protein [Streptococcus thermophilus]MCE2215691.1 hypothetical protein [Streptococcus thermophilus]